MDVFYALAEPNRRSIIEILASQGEMSATAIADKFKITSAAVSQHLKVLREAKLVKMEKRAQQRIYSVDVDTVRQLEQWAKLTTERYDRLDSFLNSNK
jgi:DNA-binding transcriptional ArsR family regulator